MIIASIKANPAMKPSPVGEVRELLDKTLLAVTASPKMKTTNKMRLPTFLNVSVYVTTTSCPVAISVKMKPITIPTPKPCFAVIVTQSFRSVISFSVHQFEG